MPVLAKCIIIDETVYPIQMCHTALVLRSAHECTKHKSSCPIKHWRVRVSAARAGAAVDSILPT